MQHTSSSTYTFYSVDLARLDRSHACIYIRICVLRDIPVTRVTRLWECGCRWFAAGFHRAHCEIASHAHGTAVQNKFALPLLRSQFTGHGLVLIVIIINSQISRDTSAKKNYICIYPIISSLHIPADITIRNRKIITFSLFCLLVRYILFVHLTD